MSRLEGKVAYITGVARGQGRSHAVRMAEEGADIIGFDICSRLATQTYPEATKEDLAETVRLVESTGRRMVFGIGDVRDLRAQVETVQMGIKELGRLDVVVANAGICTFGRTWELTEEQWEEMIDIDLSGVWRTVKATVPEMLRQQTGGSIILVSSQSGLAGFHGQAHYCAAKHGIIGMMKTLAQEVGPDHIRVNALCPTTVNTVMFNNPMMKDIFCPDLVNPSEEEFLRRASALNCFGIPYIEPDDVSEAVLYLASDASRFMTGTSFLLDAGCLAKPA